MNKAQTFRLEVNPWNTAKCILILIMALHFGDYALNPRWHFLDGVNLLIHEAGHVLFRPFGEVGMIAGGSLFQVIIPAIFVGYFLIQHQFFSGALVFFWLGESLLNVSVYAADAQAMALPLLGGAHVIHDWNYLLNEWALLPVTPIVALLIQILGALCMMGGLGLGLWIAQPSIQLKPKV